MRCVGIGRKVWEGTQNQQSPSWAPENKLDGKAGEEGLSADGASEVMLTIKFARWGISKALQRWEVQATKGPTKHHTPLHFQDSALCA